MRVVRLCKPIIVFTIICVIVNTITVENKLSFSMQDVQARQTAEQKAAKAEAKAVAKLARQTAKAEAKALKKAAKAAKKIARQAAKAEAKAARKAAKAAKKIAKQAAKAEAKAARKAAKAAKRVALKAAKGAIKQAKVAEKIAKSAALKAAKSAIKSGAVSGVIVGKTTINQGGSRVIQKLMKADFKSSPKVKQFLIRRIAYKKEGIKALSASNDNAPMQIAKVDTPKSANNSTMDSLLKSQVIEMADAGKIEVSEKELEVEYLELPENFVEIADNLSDSELADLATAAGGEEEDTISFVDVYGEKGNGLIYAQISSFSRLSQGDKKRLPLKVDHHDASRVRARTNSSGAKTIELL